MTQVYRISITNLQKHSTLAKEFTIERRSSWSGIRFENGDQFENSKQNTIQTFVTAVFESGSRIEAVWENRKYQIMQTASPSEKNRLEMKVTLFEKLRVLKCWKQSKLVIRPTYSEPEIWKPTHTGEQSLQPIKRISNIFLRKNNIDQTPELTYFPFSGIRLAIDPQAYFNLLENQEPNLDDCSIAKTLLTTKYICDLKPKNKA